MAWVTYSSYKFIAALKIKTITSVSFSAENNDHCIFELS